MLHDIDFKPVFIGASDDTGPGQTCQTLLANAMFECIAVFDNRYCRHSTLDYQTTLDHDKTGPTATLNAAWQTGAGCLLNEGNFKVVSVRRDCAMEAGLCCFGFAFRHQAFDQGFANSIRERHHERYFQSSDS